MKMKEYSFNKIVEVNAFLESIDISVPLRSKGRKTEHTERYSIVNFLLQTKNEIFTSFPTRLIHFDKPDFRIISQTQSIGIEVTESIPEQLARASFLFDKHFPEGGMFEPEFFGWDMPDRNNDEILEILIESNKKMCCQPTYGKYIEDQWMKGISGCILHKTKKLNKGDYEIFENNWLLIYDNQIRFRLDKDYIKESFHTFQNNYFNESVNRIFDKIFIEYDDYFYIINSAQFIIVKIIT
jgi:hypothetical protein